MREADRGSARAEGAGGMEAEERRGTQTKSAEATWGNLRRFVCGWKSNDTMARSECTVVKYIIMEHMVQLPRSGQAADYNIT